MIIIYTVNAYPRIVYSVFTYYTSYFFVSTWGLPLSHVPPVLVELVAAVVPESPFLVFLSSSAMLSQYSYNDC